VHTLPRRITVPLVYAEQIVGNRLNNQYPAIWLHDFFLEILSSPNKQTIRLLLLTSRLLE
jgi:hypothetical protein